MIAVTDTSPLCYLILIHKVDVLPKLFSKVAAPTAVISELLHEDAPDAVRGWAANLPTWVTVQENPTRSTAGLEKLQAGEQADFIGGINQCRFDSTRRKIGTAHRRPTRSADYVHARRSG
jgi:hypothetical protein